MEEFYEDVENTEEIIEEIFEDDTKENSEDLQEDIPEDLQDKSDTGFTSQDVVDIIKAITGNNEELSEEMEDISEPEEVSSGNSEETEEAEEDPEQNEMEIITYDYSEILQQIKNEISSGNAETRENGLLLTTLVDDNKPDSSVDSLSITNLLLICIFVLMLVEMLFKIIRGLF